MTDVKETDGAILARMGTDAQKWAREFLALDVDPDNLDEGMMIGWFANAIEAGRSAGQSTRSPTPSNELVVNGDFADGTKGWTSPTPLDEVASREVSEAVVTVNAAALAVAAVQTGTSTTDAALAASPPARPAVVSNPCCDQMRSGIWVNDRFDSPFCPVHTLPAQDEVVTCEGCALPVLRGQFVHRYEQGEVHVDCENPDATTDPSVIDPESGPVYVLLGTPLRLYRFHNAKQPAQDEVVSALVEALGGAIDRLHFIGDEDWAIDDARAALAKAQGLTDTQGASR